MLIRLALFPGLENHILSEIWTLSNAICGMLSWAWEVRTKVCLERRYTACGVKERKKQESVKTLFLGWWILRLIAGRLSSWEISSLVTFWEAGDETLQSLHWPDHSVQTSRIQRACLSSPLIDLLIQASSPEPSSPEPHLGPSWAPMLEGFITPLLPQLPEVSGDRCLPRQRRDPPLLGSPAEMRNIWRVRLRDPWASELFQKGAVYPFL